MSDSYENPDFHNVSPDGLFVFPSECDLSAEDEPFIDPVDPRTEPDLNDWDGENDILEYFENH